MEWCGGVEEGIEVDGGELSGKGLEERRDEGKCEDWRERKEEGGRNGKADSRIKEGRSCRRR